MRAYGSETGDPLCRVRRDDDGGEYRGVCVARGVLAVPAGECRGWVFAVAFAFFTNKVYVFRSRDFRRAIWLRELWEFFLARAATGIADFVGMYVLISLLCQNEILSKILLNIVVILANYLLSRYWIFR